MVALLIWFVYPSLPLSPSLSPCTFLHYSHSTKANVMRLLAACSVCFLLFSFCFLLHLCPLYGEVQWVSSKYSQSSYARQLASLARAHDCLLISSTGPDDDVHDVSPSLSSSSSPSPLPPRILCGHKFLILRFFACFDIISSGHGRCCFLCPTLIWLLKFCRQLLPV